MRPEDSGRQEQYLFSTYEILGDSYGRFLKLNLKLNKMYVEELVLCHGAQIQMRESVCPPFDALLRHINLARRPSTITIDPAAIASAASVHHDIHSSCAAESPPLRLSNITQRRFAIVPH